MLDRATRCFSVVWIAWAGVAASGSWCFGQSEPASDPRRTLTVDPVLLAEGREVAGDAGITAAHGVFTYQFAGEETRDRFLREPERYEIQFNGACARMGPLSGGGDARRWAVHEGRIYVFASESCRETFLKHADDLLERDDRALVPAGCEEADGRALIARAAEWMGGVAALEGVRTYEQSRAVMYRDSSGEYPHAESLVIEFGDDGSPARAWVGDDWFEHGMWGNALAGSSSWAVSRDGADGALSRSELVASQRRSLERIVDRSLIVVMRQALEGALVCRVSVGDVDGVGVERVAVHARGLTSVLSIEPGTGRIVALSHRDRGGASGLLGEREYRFTAWESVGGLRVPVAARALWEGEPDEQGSFEGTRVEINGEVDEAVFGVAGG